MSIVSRACFAARRFRFQPSRRLRKNRKSFFTGLPRTATSVLTAAATSWREPASKKCFLMEPKRTPQNPNWPLPRQTVDSPRPTPFRHNRSATPRLQKCLTFAGSRRTMRPGVRHFAWEVAPSPSGGSHKFVCSSRRTGSPAGFSLRAEPCTMTPFAQGSCHGRLHADRHGHG